MENEFWHVCTKGLTSGLIFRSREDYVYGMNGVAVYSLKYQAVVLAFCLMDNHVHFILRGEEQVCREFIRQYKARLATLTDVSKADACMKRIDSREYLMRAIAYVLRNPMSAGLGVLPTAYRWSSAGVYFNPEKVTAECARLRGMQTVGEIGVRRLREMVCSRHRLPDDYVLAPDGMVCPECYVDWRSVEELFVRPSRLLYVMSRNDDMEMELTGDILRKVKYTDAELHGSVSGLCWEMFRCGAPESLPVEHRCRLAKELRKRYGLGPKQLSRLTGVSYDLLKELI